MILDKVLLSDIVEWEVKSWGRAVKFWDDALPQVGEGRLALDVGARRGGLSLYLAMKGFRVICTDLDTPEETARPLHERYRMTDRISYQSANAIELPFPDNTFDAVAFKSLLGSVGRDGQIDLQQRAISEFHRVLAPGGYMLFAENLAATRFHMFLRRKFNRWGNYCQYIDVDLLKQSLGIFSDYRYETFGFTAALGRKEYQREALYYLDAAIDGIIPSSWQYLVYGYARK